MGGYDTHSNTITNQTNLFNQLFPAMRAFYDYTVAAGVANDVAQVTHVGLQPHVDRQRQLRASTMRGAATRSSWAAR